MFGLKSGSEKGETESLFIRTAALCILLGILLGMLLDGGLISEPAMWFYLPTAAYLIFRVIGWKVLGCTPVLTKSQKSVIGMLPILGFAPFILISYMIRSLRT